MLVDGQEIHQVSEGNGVGSMQSEWEMHRGIGVSDRDVYVMISTL